MSLELKKFNPTVIEENKQKGISSIVCIVGKRKTGKTTMAINIYKELKKPLFTIVMTVDNNKELWKQYLDEKYIFNNLDINLLGGIIEDQKKKINDLKNKGLDPNNHPEINICIIIEELFFNQSIFNEHYIKELFFSGRHYFITTIITHQFMLSIPLRFRTNIDYFIACRDNNEDNKKRLHNYFFGIFCEFEDFQKVFDEYTKNNGFLILDATKKSLKIEDQVFYYNSEIEDSVNVSDVEVKVNEKSLFTKFLDYLIRKNQIKKR